MGSEVLLLLLENLCHTVTGILGCNLCQVIQMWNYAVQHNKTVAVLFILQTKYFYSNSNCHGDLFAASSSGVTWLAFLLCIQ
jgi:hypothetical protein